MQIEQATAGKAELGLALKLFNLTDFEVLHEPALQTKVLMLFASSQHLYPASVPDVLTEVCVQVLLGWSTSCAVLAFRGTASAVNAWNDLKACHHLALSTISSQQHGRGLC